MRIRLFSALIAALSLGLLAAVTPALAADNPPAFSDDFESTPVGTWAQDTTYGAWHAEHDGYGTFGIANTSSHVMMQAPKASTSLGETHSSLVRSVQSYGDLNLTARLRTVKQLRTPTPNAWEVAWLNWHFVDNETFYYIVLKPNGWELGKVDGTEVNPSGPKCYWPSYENCAYPGAQRFLATGSSPAFPVGPWYAINVRQVGNQINISVNGTQLVAFTDDERPYTEGQISLYNEDSHVEFDDVTIEPLGPLPPAPAPEVVKVSTSPSRAVQPADKFAVKWAADAPASTYDVIYTRASYAQGDWSGSQSLRDDTPYTAANFAGTIGYSYCFRARARNADGVESTFGNRTCATRPIDERSLYRTGSWSGGTNSGMYLGTYLSSTQSGSTLRRVSLGLKQVWVIVTKCPRCGTLDVYVGRARVARLSLYASKGLRKQLIKVYTLPTARDSSVTLKVASSGRPVIVEGLGLLRMA